MRQDRKKTAHNKVIENTLKGLIKEMRKNPTKKALQEVTSSLDKATKKKLIHANKAARLKSRLSKLLSSKDNLAPKKAPKPKSAVKKSSKNNLS